MTQALIGVVMGSQSDWETLQHATRILQEFDIPFHARVLSAHRMPDDLFAYAQGARQAGLHAIIAGAGGAAHLPGMIAAATTLPVIGVPVPLKYLDGMDSLLSIVQMPAGIPVATVGVGNAKNAGLLAARILGTSDAGVAAKVADLMEKARVASLEKGKNLSRKNQRAGF